MDNRNDDRLMPRFLRSIFGAAGSLVIVLLWVYHSAQILFLGARFTQIYSNKYGSRFKPTSGVEEVAWR